MTTRPKTSPSRDKVAFPSDDQPWEQADQLLILGADDYYVQVVHAGRVPIIGPCFRACTSGARDPLLTMTFSMLFKYGRDEIDAAIENAKTLVSMLEQKKRDRTP